MSSLVEGRVACYSFAELSCEGLVWEGPPCHFLVPLDPEVLLYRGLFSSGWQLLVLHLTENG